MGTNVIYLAGLASAPSGAAAPAPSSIPAYRRARQRNQLASGGAPAQSSTRPSAYSPASWVIAAQRRAAMRLAAAELPLVTPSTSAKLDHELRVSIPEGQTGDRMGRLRLSGRLVDVCAELERLAQAEAATEAMMRRA